jgi:hypothetical protein
MPAVPVHFGTECDPLVVLGALGPGELGEVPLGCGAGLLGWWAWRRLGLRVAVWEFVVLPTGAALARPPACLGRYVWALNDSALPAASLATWSEPGW